MYNLRNVYISCVPRYLPKKLSSLEGECLAVWLYDGDGRQPF